MLWITLLMLALALGVTNGQDYTVRLTGGGKSGRVEVLYNGNYGYICKGDWDFYDAMVVCRQLGYKWLDPGWSKVEASVGTEAAVLSGVQCKGTEYNLGSCPSFGLSLYSCTEGPASVACYELGDINGPTTSTYLLNGGNAAEGKVVIKIQPGVTDAKPYIICDLSWGKADADVICRQAGYHSAAMATTSSYFGVPDQEDVVIDTSTSFLAERFNCQGSETNIVACPAENLLDGGCVSYSHEAGVTCNRIEEPEDFQLRIADGESAKEGRVEVFMNGKWGYICKSNVSTDVKLSYEETNVICKQAGQGYGVESLTDNRFGLSSLPAVMTGDFDCYGGEPSFAQCFNNASGTAFEECGGSSARYEVSVICSGPVEESRQPIKQDGNDLLIYHDERWLTVCDLSWTMSNAKVACKELGMGPPEEERVESDGSKRGPIFAQTVYCDGDEESLDKCEQSVGDVSRCKHSMDVALVCTPEVNGGLAVTSESPEVNGGLAVTSESDSLIFAILTAMYCVFN